MHSTNQLTYKKLSAFFIPLGISASFTSFTHVIINGALSRGENATFILASFAVAMSLFGIIERPMVVFRQTSSALVTDQKSFKLLRSFFSYVLLFFMFISVLISYTPLGSWMYVHIFNASGDMVNAISSTFKILSLVIVFSGIRTLYQGVVINQLATNWLTIGVVVRLIAMLVTSYLFVVLGFITSMSGAIIFLIGMIVECSVSVFKGNSLLKGIGNKDNRYRLLKVDISKFYFPLMFYHLIQTVLIPVIYILLARSNDLEMSIASYALSNSIVLLILGFFMYTHQLVLQFYEKNRRKVIKFLIIISVIPTLLLSIICYTPLGMVFMQDIMGADESLAIATIAVLKFFIIKTLVFPWVDFLNGFLMLRRQTNKMLISQTGNLIIVIISLLFLVPLFPHLDGVNGSLAASLGELAGLVIISTIIYRMNKSKINRSQIS